MHVESVCPGIELHEIVVTTPSRHWFKVSVPGPQQKGIPNVCGLQDCPDKLEQSSSCPFAKDTRAANMTDNNVCCIFGDVCLSMDGEK